MIVLGIELRSGTEDAFTNQRDILTLNQYPNLVCEPMQCSDWVLVAELGVRTDAIF